MALKYPACYLWPLLNRVKDKRANFEPVRMYIDFSDKEVVCPEHSRMLFHTRINTIFNQRMFKFETDIFFSAYPFEQVANCIIELRETLNIDTRDWLGYFTEVGKPIQSEFKNFLQEEPPGYKGLNVTKKLKSIESGSNWIGPVETRHTVIPDYCEFANMFAFMCFAGPVTSIGKHAILRWLKEKGTRPYPDFLEKKLGYQNYKLWVDTKRALYLNDRFSVETSYMQSGGNHYLKHEIHLEKPRLLSMILLEEYLS
ncbi:hypothetical protein ACFL52_03485 [Candidatus Margulisiibacteriota bacterium]